MSTDTDTIPPNRADEYFAANPTEEKEVYWNHLKLSTVDWDRLEITAPEIYRSIIGEYIRIFLPDHGITSIRLNMINYSKMSQKWPDYYNTFKRHVLDEIDAIPGDSLGTFQRHVNQFLFLTWKAVPAKGAAKDVAGTKAMQKKLTAMVAEPPPPTSKKEIEERNNGLRQAATEAANNAAQAATTSTEDEGDTGGGGQGNGHGNGNGDGENRTETETNILQSIGANGPIYIQSKDVKFDPFKQPRRLLDIPEEFDKWWRQGLIAFQWHGIKTDEEIYNAFIRFGGPDIDEEDRFGQIPPNVPPGASKLDILMAKLKKRYIPFDPLLYYRVRFFQSKPKPGEAIGAYVTRLRKLAFPCQWGDLQDTLILTVLLTSMNDEQMLIRALMDNYSLERLIARKAAKEITQEQARFMSNGHGDDHDGMIGRTFKGNMKRTEREGKECFNCGREWPHADGICPAKGKTCNYCGKDNHFRIKCKKKDADQKERGKRKDEKSQKRDHSKKHKEKGKGKGKRSVKKADHEEDKEEEEEDSDSESQTSEGSFTK